MKIITVPVAKRKECHYLLETAFQLADDLDANVSGLHVRPHREESIGGDYGIISPIAMNNMSQWYKADLDDELESQAAAELFKEYSDKHDFTFKKSAAKDMEQSSLWNEMVGDPQSVFSVAGPVSDIVLVSRPKKKSSGQAKQFLSAALFNTGRPVLMLPQKKLTSVGKRVLIAWNQQDSVMQTIISSMALLKEADQVTILSAGPDNRARPKTKHLQDYLKVWGIDSDVKFTKGIKVHDEIIDTYTATGSDLLLMGAYSRGRFTEWFMGGFTKYMLTDSTIPTLMQHS
ncbi:universal stress protein [Marinicella gelatinilytica]|uniref:universal stress protein n=1 Tax=Marinicella gelatinilytica TaxID=2996017 RepID=UPI002260A33E|nr:universal stress protein [Marinicella gelatinilytica]MCX7546017.1 universal stress protein [Marinicella gelatinilytica]